MQDIVFGKAKGMVCETKLYEINISHFKCIRKIRFDA